MFFFGFFVGAGVAAWFILQEHGERLIHLGQRMNAAARAFRDWQERSVD